MHITYCIPLSACSSHIFVWRTRWISRMRDKTNMAAPISPSVYNFYRYVPLQSWMVNWLNLKPKLDQAVTIRFELCSDAEVNSKPLAWQFLRNGLWLYLPLNRPNLTLFTAITDSLRSGEARSYDIAEFTLHEIQRFLLKVFRRIDTDRSSTRGDF